MNGYRLSAALALALGTAGVAAPAFADSPQFRIVDLGVTAGNTNSQAVAISPDGNTITGRGLIGGSTWPAFSWTASTGMVSLAPLSPDHYAQGNGVNNAGEIVGTTTATFFGSGPRPTLWVNGAATAIALPDGQTYGRAYGINNAGWVAGSSGSDFGDMATLYNIHTGSATTITAVSAAGTNFTTAYGINNSGMMIGEGTNTAVQSAAVIYNANTGVLTDIAPLAPTSLAFGVSNSGFVVGSQGYTGTPYIWSAATGLVEIPMLDGAAYGAARGVNDAGWAVGNYGTDYSVPFLYAGGTRYVLGSLITNSAGWNFDTSTSTSADSISDNGIIVGSAEFNGEVHAYMLVPVPEPSSWALMVAGIAGLGVIARRRGGLKSPARG